MPVIDETSAFGARAARHLREEVVVWLTTVTPGGAPVPRPVWFIWDGADSVVMYSQPKARIRNLAYDEHIARIGMTHETLAREYSVPVQIRLTKLQGH